MRSAWLCVVLAGCGITDGEYFGRVPEPDPTHFRFCNSGEPEFWDPALSTSTTDRPIYVALFDGLTTYDENGDPTPSLATRWEVSEDQKTFTFHLRDDARWSNGRPITAHDFVYSVVRILNPLSASRNAEPLWRLEHAKAYHERRARLMLRDVGPFKAGEVVGVVPEKDARGKLIDFPDANLRVTAEARDLHAEPRADSETYRRVPAGEEITIVELDATRTWAYVYWLVGEGVYGWTRLEGLKAPNDGVRFEVEALGDPEDARRKGVIHGRDALMLPEVVGVRAAGDHTLVLKTEGPTPFLIQQTPERWFRPTPREAVSRWPGSWTHPEKIVTSGPFHLTFWRMRDKFEMVKSPTFWGRDDIKLERITAFSMNEQHANVGMYYQGGCDALASAAVPATYRPVFAGEKGGTKKKDYTRAPYLGIYFYIINLDRFPNVHFRRALSHALDRRHLPEILKGGEVPSEQFTPGTPIAKLTEEQRALCGVEAGQPGHVMIVEADRLCYVPPLGARFDLDKAREELEVARKQMGKDFPQSFTVRFNTGVESHKHIAEWIQHEWKKNLGLDVNLESQEWKIFLKDTSNKEYDIARMGWIGSSPNPESDFLIIFRCGNPNNRTGFCNAEFDRLYAEAEKTADLKERLALIRRAEEIMITEQPVIPLYVYTQHHLQKPYVRDLHINFPDNSDFRWVWIDPDWKQKQAGGTESPRR